VLVSYVLRVSNVGSSYETPGAGAGADSEISFHRARLAVNSLEPSVELEKWLSQYASDAAGRTDGRS
jgi:hypothetical protein